LGGWKKNKEWKKRRPRLNFTNHGLFQQGKGTYMLTSQGPESVFEKKSPNIKEPEDGIEEGKN